jgi:hypothetical protein
MRKTLWSIFGRVAILVVLYPWLVSFDGPGDSLSHTISIYGSDGSYTHVTRDCNGNLTSVLPVPFGEIAASYEAPLEVGYNVRLRGGNLHSLYGYNLINGDSAATASNVNIAYGGASLDLNRQFVGLDLGVLVFSRSTLLSDAGSSDRFAFTGELRLGHLDAWYFTMSLLNTDPLIGSRPYFNTGLGFSLGKDSAVAAPPGHLWFGVGLGPPYEYTDQGSIIFQPQYDGLLAAELSVPAFNVWTILLRGAIDPGGHGGAYLSGGLSYGW